MLSTLLAVNPTNIVVDENGEAGDNIVPYTQRPKYLI